METRLFVYGASGHGKVIMSMAILNNDFDEYFFIDDNPREDILNGIKVKKRDEIIFKSGDRFVLGIGDNKTRNKVANVFLAKYQTIVHPRAVLAAELDFGEGTVIMANAVINSNALIGKHCIINSGAIVEHDCILSDYVHISPNAALAGGVVIGIGTHVGIGASIIQGVTIGKHCTVGAGSVIVSNIPDYAVVVGSPGKIIKFNN
jgi:sugar O-acyltransferase (sialic acid O-acetyltransferase NeuD family)